MKRSNAWKRLEKKTAELLGGERMNRGQNFSQELPDVLASKFCVECKYRSKGMKFLYDMLLQADSYNTGKMALGIFKSRGKQDEIAIMRFSDFVELLKRVT